MRDQKLMIVPIVLNAYLRDHFYRRYVGRNFPFTSNRYVGTRHAPGKNQNFGDPKIQYFPSFLKYLRRTFP